MSIVITSLIDGQGTQLSTLQERVK